jgi:hypothetical protein
VTFVLSLVVRGGNMTRIGRKVIIAGVAALALAGCSSTVTKTVKVTQSPAGAPSAAAGAPSAAADAPSAAPQTLTCHSQADPEGIYWQSSVTVQQVIGYVLAAMTLDAGNIASGNLSSNDSKILDNAGGALREVGGQETTALSNDTYTFGSDEEAYNPSGGPTDPSYTQRLIDDEQALVKDCPGAKAVAAKMENG